MAKNLAALFLIVIMASTNLLMNSSIDTSASTEANDTILDGWHNINVGGFYSENSGIITLSGDDHCFGPTLIKELDPQDDFEISMDLKAETLGEISQDPLGAGEGSNSA